MNLNRGRLDFGSDSNPRIKLLPGSEFLNTAVTVLYKKCFRGKMCRDSKYILKFISELLILNYFAVHHYTCSCKSVILLQTRYEDGSVGDETSINDIILVCCDKPS